MITVKGVKKRFGKVQALANVSFNVQAGEIFGIVGPDGAGKTTLIRLICGLLTPDEGKIGINAGGSLGYMPQRFSLYGDLTVRENLQFFGALYGLSKEIIIKRSEEILALTNLLPFQDRFAEQLSGGMKQKLSLTCALVTQPKLLLLDEPTYGVDPESRKEFWKILYQLNAEGVTILVSTPYMDEAELCSHVAFLSEGRLTALATPKELVEGFAHQVWEVRTEVREPGLFVQGEGVMDSALFGDKYRLIIEKKEDAENLIKSKLKSRGLSVFSIEQVRPRMEDIFVLMAGGEKAWSKE
ncbi:MAG TPA: ABC transporter ATP-binding protein [Peptococcaceae bacterium]|nr:ABC transporter ATP-binding protein [Peptococcaceae bacterium]